MAGLDASLRSGKVNGLQRPAPRAARRFRAPARHPTSLLVVGVGLYAAALLFPLFLRQVTEVIAGAAVLGTALFLLGLHFRWNRESAEA